ncbi:MAG: hypothetical protein JSV18_01510 [Candidatus Bathyarchaeota archaeon]|nr:MAG: hypothetical protein JSV18_01510 [Candidatus Bathyarchaeota archaeon]
MKKKQMMFVFFISFLLLYSLISESSITNVYACTNFKIKDDQAVFFGNSEDHAFRQISDVFITFVPSGQTWYDGSKLEYGAVVVGYANGSGNSWIQGGMNEKGLAFDSSSVPNTEPNLHDERPPNLVPEIFSCETISEVVEYKKTHGVYQQEGSVQSFYVDKSGESVVFNIGEDGEFQFYRNNERYQLASNFYVEDSSRRNPGSDAIRRYSAAEQVLNNIVKNGDLSIESITLVLDSVHFEGPAVNTLYSNIFDVTSGDIYLYFFHQFEEVVKLNLEEELAKGRHTYRISDLFTQETVDNAFNEYHEYPFLIRVFPTDLILLFVTMILDIILVFASVFLVGKNLLHRTNESNEEILGQNLVNGATFKGLYLQIILSLAIFWSFLSFPMIYWNHNGEWWPFFDNIPILQWPLQPFYAFHNIFLLMSSLGVVLIAFLLSSFTNRGEAVQLVKRGLDLGKERKRRNMVILSTPVLIGIFYLFLEILDIIPKVDWLMFAIMYPSIVTMLIILIPYAEKKGIKKQDFPQDRSRINLLKAIILLILTWGLWFLPLLLTGIVDHMYVLLLVNLSTSIIIFTFIEVFQEKFPLLQR